MADRRMFSKRITNSAKFLKMGEGAQALYFHLCLAADDDGIVEAFAVRQMVGAREDSLNNLAGRGFVTILDQENEILYINDWLEHNKLRADRVTPSIYRPLLQNKVQDVHLIEPRQRADRPQREKVIEAEIIDVEDQDNVPRTTKGQPMDGHGTSQGRPRDNHGTDMGQPMDGIGKDRLGKDRLSQDKSGKDKQGEGSNGASAPTNRKRFMRPSIQEIKEYCTEKGYTHVDAEYFWNYYENINWHVGKNKMKSWKLAVANWEKRQIEFERQKGAAANQQTGLFMQHTEEEKKDTWGWD